MQGTEDSPQTVALPGWLGGDTEANEEEEQCKVKQN